MNTAEPQNTNTSPTPTPQFDKRFTSSEIFYFHHIIDPENATLKSQVLGPNLSNTFSHSEARTRLTPYRIGDALRRKTTGFLALIRPGTNSTRTILAWAESGHGHNPHGDSLEAKSTVLGNKVWTARVIKLAKKMRINIGHPYDGLTRGGKVGLFRASHVEVKLAVHAVYVLLKIFNIPTKRVTKRELEKLREKKWPDGSRPKFEIYFSKKNCPGCAKYVRLLEELTGAEIKLCWKDRLVKIEYEMGKMGVPQNREGETGGARGGEVVDLTDEAEDVVEVTPEPLGAYINGLAYCVGQMGCDEGRVKGAIVGLARIARRQAVRVEGRRVERMGRRVIARPTTPVSEKTSTWLATPPSTDRRIRGRQASPMGVAETRGLGMRARSPRCYSFTSGDVMPMGR
ncbi:hypothetical protein VFPPC_06957 [Pochonia chlamydosporia 170]|uniref:Uncharacterized protein n=1 Tax=Pochonia chlamydosporia 170 TaxID=1380566 RepID=A0A179FAH8_METCM|nr:hypothetical protein VFPPC_06957 [Pochonia chlamydosporia 170]OAQ62417.1 hypothetical protein VFPPC_06957 [Pochonia chlamydosporia 170]